MNVKCETVHPKGEKLKIINPIFNYIGGKRWLRDELRGQLNFISVSRDISHVNRYIEPFCGGLGAFINVYDLLLSMGIKKVVLNDINSHLIDFYNTVIHCKKELLNYYMQMENEFSSVIPERVSKLNKRTDKKEIKVLLNQADRFFRKIKSDFNDFNTLKNKDLSVEDKIKKSAQLLFLQNHSFNAIYRENSRGEYNTPFNWDGKIFTYEKIDARLNEFLFVVSQFEHVEFTNESFESIEYDERDLIYCDPPYVNKESKGENKYNQTGFTIDDQILLIERISHYQFIYSNHKHSVLINTFDKHTKYLLKEVKRKNIMSSKSESRSEDKVEILVTKLSDVSH